MLHDEAQARDINHLGHNNTGLLGVSSGLVTLIAILIWYSASEAEWLSPGGILVLAIVTGTIVGTGVSWLFLHWTKVQKSKNEAAYCSNLKDERARQLVEFLATKEESN